LVFNRGKHQSFISMKLVFLVGRAVDFNLSVVLGNQLNNAHDFACKITPAIDVPFNYIVDFKMKNIVTWMVMVLRERHL